MIVPLGNAWLRTKQNFVLTCSNNKRGLTPAEDQLLLQYMAASGPQFVVDGDAMVHIAAHLLPGRSRKQVLARVNQSILNPNLHRDAWSEEEERRLAICMKVYCDKERVAVSGWSYGGYMAL
jgi:hypothetical protein